jgi:molecular chaperone HscB
MSNYFELYNIPESFSPDQAVVKSRFYELSRQYHPDRYAQAGGAELANALQLSAMNNEAYKTLRNPDATMAYLLKLHSLLEDEEKYALPPAFLMEMMEINEAVSDYEDSPSEDARQLATTALDEQLELWTDATTALTRKWQAGDHTEALLLRIKDQYFRKKYLLRIKERIDKFAAL